MRLALFEPDIPQNAGTMVRLATCLGLTVDLIDPCGFVLDSRHFRRAGMDYLDRAAIVRHASWSAFERSSVGARLVLLTTRGSLAYTVFDFRADDILLVGRESSGVPDFVHAAAAERIRVPMIQGVRSLNVAVAAAMVVGEALRQTGGFPEVSS